MKRAILMSIQPQWLEKISNYIKTAKYTIKYIKGGPVNEKSI